MNNSNTQNCDEDFESDDLITFQHDSTTINFYYSQLTKYSKNIRESYLFSDVNNRIPQELRKLQEESRLLPENVDLFFQLLQQNYNINEDSIFTYIQCKDLLKISKFLEVRKLTSNINKYIKSRNMDVDFIIQMIQYNVETQPETSSQQIKINSEIEQMLTSKINVCFSNEKFGQLPIEIIYRVVSQSSPELINSNKLFDIIIKSLSKYCVLFQFLDLQKLSNDRLEELCEMYSKSNENTRHFFDYLKCNLDFINEINNRKKNLQEMNDELQNQLSQLQKQLTEFRNKRQIIASIENGFIINAEINLMLNDSALDTSKSKVIISTSDAKCLGSEAYEKGEPITSHHMKTSFIRKPGTYYVRCIVFNSEGESNEIVSNSVTTSENCLAFGYEGEPVNSNVHIKVLKVENLTNIDSNSSGSFVKISVGDEEANTEVKEMSTSIEWDQEFDFVSSDFISDKLVLQLYKKGAKSTVNKRMIEDLTFPLIKFKNIEYSTPTIYKVPMKMRGQEIGQISFEFSSTIQK